MNVERMLEQRAIPRVIYHESLFDENYPYEVAFSSEACADFLLSNGMSSENVSKLNILLRGTPISVFTEASYSPVGRVVELPVLRPNGFELKLLKSLAHELKHAINHSNDKCYVIKHGAVRVTGGLIGFSLAVLPAALASADNFSYESAFSILALIPVGGVLGYCGMMASNEVNPEELTTRRFTKRLDVSKLQPIISVKRRS